MSIILNSYLALSPFNVVTCTLIKHILKRLLNHKLFYNNKIELKDYLLILSI